MSPKTKEAGTFPNLFYEASITSMPKPGKEGIKRKENYWPKCLMSIESKILNKIEQPKFSSTLKASCAMIQ